MAIKFEPLALAVSVESLLSIK